MALEGILLLSFVTRTSDDQMEMRKWGPLTFMDSLMSEINKLRKREEK